MLTSSTLHEDTFTISQTSDATEVSNAGRMTESLLSGLKRKESQQRVFRG
jgi:hypothetical protein